MTNTVPETCPGCPLRKEASGVSLPSGNWHLAEIHTFHCGNLSQRTTQASGTGPSLSCGLPGGRAAAGRGAPSASPAFISGSEAGRKENLGFVVWLFLTSFCFGDPLPRENNALNRPQASLALALARLQGEGPQDTMVVRIHGPSGFELRPWRITGEDGVWWLVCIPS